MQYVINLSNNQLLEGDNFKVIADTIEVLDPNLLFCLLLSDLELYSNLQVLFFSERKTHTLSYPEKQEMKESELESLFINAKDIVQDDSHIYY